MTFIKKWTLDNNGRPAVAAGLQDATRVVKVDAYGTFGGGTVQMQYSPDNGTTWVDITDAALTANGNVLLRFVPGQLIAPNLSGATNPDLTIEINECVS